MSAKRHDQGMKWIRASRRLAIYVRDGFACCWCGAHVSRAGIKLTLDHVKPTTRGGTHASRNLVTACMGCNRQRCTTSAPAYARRAAAAHVHGWPADAVLAHVRRQVRRRVNVPAARELLRASTLGGVIAKLNET